MHVGGECKYWPLLANYNWTDKMFSCSGHIIGFKLCNRWGQHNIINLGLSLWRREAGVLDTRAEYSLSHNIISLENQMNFTNGDQLMLTIIYYGWTSDPKYVHNMYI